MTLYLSQKELLLLLLAAFAIGFLLALMYDLLRLFRLMRKPRSALTKGIHHFLTALEDLAFFLFCGAVFSILFFVLNSGRVRLSAFFMAFLGFLLCRMTLSRLIFPLLIRLTKTLKALLVCVFSKLILPPIRFILLLVRRAFYAISLHRRRKKTQKLLASLKTLGKNGYFDGLRRLRHRAIQKDGIL